MAAKRRSGNLGGVSRKKQVQLGFNLNTDPKVGQGGKSSVPRTTPSGAVAAKQRAQAASDSPLKDTTQKKPPSGKNEASPSAKQFQVEVTDPRGRKTVFQPLPGGTADSALEEAQKAHPDSVKFKTSRKDLTPSGAVADKQRKQAVKDSPIKAQPTKAPRAKRNNAEDEVGIQRAAEKIRGSGLRQNDPDAKHVAEATQRIQSYNPKTGPTAAQKKANAAAMGKDPAKVKSGRKLSMDPKQVARRAKRGFPNGR